MLLFNADGQIAEMSGNGAVSSRGSASAGVGDGKRLVVDTGGGRRQIDVPRLATTVMSAATVDMGPAAITSMTPTSRRKSTVSRIRGDTVDVGNPHYVLFVDDPGRNGYYTPVPVLEHDRAFPNRPNVEFVSRGLARTSC